MKKFIKMIVLGLLFAVSFSANAQYSSSPSAYGSPTRWNLYNKGIDTQSQVVTYPYANSHYTSIQYTPEVISTHQYTLQGTSHLAKLTATDIDTLTLVGSKLTPRSFYEIYSTNTGNDSTCIIPASGTFQGASKYYWTSASFGTLKSITFYFDSTNYYIISNK